MGKTLAAHTEPDLTMCCCLLLRSSSFWFERLVEWACLDEGVDFAMGHCRKYKSSRGADGCCHVWENSSNFQRVHFVKIFRTSRIKVDMHPFQSCWGQTQLLTKNLNTFSQRYTQSCTCLFFNCTKLLRAFQTACHVIHTLGNAHWWRKGLFISL